MSRDIITVDWTMRISLLYRGEYSQWRERFMNYLEEQTDGEAIINSIQNGDQPLPVIAQYATLMRQTKNLMDINIDALYNILKQNQGDVNDALGYKKKAIVVHSDPSALVVEKTNIIAFLAKAFNRRKFYSKPTNNNLRTSSTSQSANKKQEFVKTDNKKVKKKDDEKKRDMSRVKCYNCKKEGHFAKDCKKVKEINANMVFMAQIEKVISNLEASSSSADENIYEQTSSLKPYVSNVILENIIIDLEDEVMSLLEKEKANLETIDSLKLKGFESSENVSSKLENQTKNDCLVVEKEYDKEENPNVIAPGMFKLNVSQCVSPISMSKLSCDSKNVEIKLKRKRRKRKSSKQNVKQVDNDKKRSSNTFNVGLSAVSVSNLNKNVKRYSRKDLLACNNSHLGETSSAYVCNNAMNVSCDSRMNDLLADNNFFIFDDKSVRISPVSKMPFRKKPCDSMIVRSKSNMNKSLPRTVHKWLPKMQPLAESVAKWFPRVKHQIDKISKTPNSPRPIYKWVPKFLGTVRFGKNDFAVITGYGDVVIVSKVSEASKKDLEDLFQDFYDEYFDSSKIMKSLTTNVESSNVEVLSPEEEVFHEISDSFQGESSSSSLNDDVQQFPKEVILPQTNTQSISNNMIPNGDDASTSHNVFNERLEDAYFDDQYIVS
nr:hypothetical protein [Tanacetum cinerariifolium]